MKTNRLQVRVMLLLGVAVCLILPGVLASRALRTAHAGATGASRQVRTTEALDAARAAALGSLQAQLKAGAPFSHEEIDILGRFGSGGAVDAMEADVLISRVLYAYFIGNDLSADGQVLLERYKEHIAPRTINVADLKGHIQAIELKEPPRAPDVAPTNDLCAGAEVIPGAGPFPFFTAVTADITDATGTGDPPTPSCQPSISRSIWYTFTPSTTAVYTISSCADAPTGSTVDDTVMAVYTSGAGCGGPFTEIPTGAGSDGCDDDTCTIENLQSVLTTSLTSGTQYFIVMWKFGASAPTAGNTAVQLRITQDFPPANDTCAGAIPLTLNTAVSGATNGGTANDYQLTGTTCFTGIGQTSTTAMGRDVVYSFTAPSAGNYSFTINFVNAFNAVLYVSTSCPAAPATLTCDNVSGPAIAAANRNSTTSNTSESVQCLALTNGQQVFAFVDEASISAGGGPFIIKVTQCATAAGNEIEPNGTPATASALACGAQGGIVPAADVDFYALGTPAAGSRVFAMADAASASSNDFDMRITTTTDTLEYDDLNLDTPFGSLAPMAAGTPLTGVASFIRMNHFSASTQSEPYRLFSVVQPPGAGLGGSSATAETEPNDTTPNANSATNNFFSGLAGSAGEVDMFCFSATAGDVVFLALDTDPLRNNTPFNGALALLSSTGAVLVSVNDTGFTSSTTTGAGSLTATTPFSPAEGIVFTIQTTGTYIARVTVGGGSPSATSDYLLSISKNCAAGGGGCAVVPVCTGITCPANVTQTNDPNQCGAVVTYPAPTSSGTCGTINCSPASGSFFPVGTTTVTCTSSAGPTCTFTVTVTDDQEPTITCPADQVRSNDPDQCGAVVNYPPPTVTDNCPGSFTATCSPPSGSFFPVGTTTVTCEVDSGDSAPAKPATGAKLIVPDAKASSASAGKVGANASKGGIKVGAKPIAWSGVIGKAKAPSLPKSPFAVLYSQTDNPAATGTSSQNFEAAFDTFDNELADDFVVTAGENWTIDQVFVAGLYFNGPGPASSVNVVFYSDTATLPGAVVATRTNQTIADVLGDFTVTLSPIVVLAPGTYWVSVQANQDLGTAGQWGWTDRTTTSNSGSAWRNPGGGFGTTCTPGFGRKTDCIANSSPDAIFQILGTSAPIGGGGGGSSCTFTVTVNDTQPPTITCPPNQTAVTPTVNDPCAVVNFTTTASDNCPGVTVVCNPPSGSCFPVGVTTVTCTATDASGNTATCTFTVSVFNGRLQDDFEACNNTVLFNTLTGDYRWCCHGTIFIGKGKITRVGDNIRLEHNAPDRRVRIDLTGSQSPPTGNGAIQSPPGTVRCVLQDRDTRDDTCLCGAPAPPT